MPLAVTPDIDVWGFDYDVNTVWDTDVTITDIDTQLNPAMRTAMEAGTGNHRILVDVASPYTGNYAPFASTAIPSDSCRILVRAVNRLTFTGRLRLNGPSNCRFENFRFQNSESPTAGAVEILRGGVTIDITSITQANPAVVTVASAHGRSNGDKVYVSGGPGMSQLKPGQYELANVTATTAELVGVDSTAYDAYTSGGVVGVLCKYQFEGNQFGHHWAGLTDPDNYRLAFLAGAHNTNIKFKNNDVRGVSEACSLRTGFHHVENNLLTDYRDDFVARTCSNSGIKFNYLYSALNIAANPADLPTDSLLHPDFNQTGTGNDGPDDIYETQVDKDLAMMSNIVQYASQGIFLSLDSGSAKSSKGKVTDSIILVTGPRGISPYSNDFEIDGVILATPPTGSRVPYGSPGFNNVPISPSVYVSGSAVDDQTSTPVARNVLANAIGGDVPWTNPTIENFRRVDHAAALGTATALDTIFPNMTGLTYDTDQVVIPAYSGSIDRDSIRQYITQQYEPVGGWSGNNMTAPNTWGAESSAPSIIVGPRTQRFALNTTAGMQDLTIPGIGPCSAIVVVAGRPGSDSIIADAGLSFGFATDPRLLGVSGTQSGSCASVSTEDGASGNTDRRTSATRCVFTYSSNGSIDSEATVDEFITDGVRLNLVDAPIQGSYIDVTFFPVSAFPRAIAGLYSIPDGAGHTQPINVDMPVDMLFFAGIGAAGVAVSTAYAIMHLGMAVNDGGISQAGLCYWDEAGASPSSAGGMVSHSSVGGQVNNTIAWDATVTAMGQGEFSVASSANTNGDTIFYLALEKAPEVNLAIVNSDGPSATGGYSIAGAGFEPSFGMTLAGSASVLNAASAGDGVLSVSSFDESAQFTKSISSQDDVSPSNASTLSSPKALHYIKDGATHTDATFTGFDADGASFTVAAAPSTAAKISTLFVGVPSEPDDTTPDQFELGGPITGVARDSQHTSNTITVSGINTASPISISNGEYSVNGGAYTSANGNANESDTVTVRVTASSSYEFEVRCDLFIGGVVDTFSVTTLDAPDDSIPDAFDLGGPANGVDPGTRHSADDVTVSGINVPVSISVTNAEYRLNSDLAYTSAPGSVVNGDVIHLRVTASESGGTEVIGTLNVGSVSDTFSVTTIVSAGEAPTVVVQPEPEYNLLVGQYFELDVAALFSDTDSTLNYSVSSGELPAGLTLNTVSGLLSGTPVIAGSLANVVFRATEVAI